jgi:hypothetical protein
MRSGSNTVSEPSGATPTFLFQGAGTNVIDGGGNGTVDFSLAPLRLVVNLQNHSATGGFAGSTQTITGIKNVIGTNASNNDILIAGPPGGVIHGNGTGADLLVAGPQGGDTLYAGAGSTTFCSEADCSAGAATGGGRTFATRNQMFGGPGEDSFFVRNSGYDSIDGGGGFLNVAKIDRGLDTAVRIQVFLP